MNADLDAERARIASEYRRRRDEDDDEERYAAWQPAYALDHASRVRAAAAALKRAGVFPSFGQRCLEVGCGPRGWLADLVSFGVPERDIAAIDLDAEHVRRVRALLPVADVRVGDASALPFASESFSLVIASTVFTSILSRTMRAAVAAEILRVLCPGGALLWYDFAYDNPRNKSVKGVRRGEVRSLFPSLRGDVEAITLAPPIARLVAPRSWLLATALEAIPLLRTHLLAVLVKP